MAGLKSEQNLDFPMGHRVPYVNRKSTIGDGIPEVLGRSDGHKKRFPHLFADKLLGLVIGY